jgi:hypothetical protein
MPMPATHVPFVQLTALTASPQNRAATAVPRAQERLRQPSMHTFYTNLSIRRRYRRRFHAATRMIAPQPAALPRNTDAIVQSLMFTTA